jgi:hypothetical protein
MEAKMAPGDCGRIMPRLRSLALGRRVLALRVLALAFGALAPLSGALAQGAECDSLRAALARPVSVDPGAAAGARKARAELDRASAYAHSIGCDNQQFLFFGSAPPPQCGGLKTRIGALKSQYDAYAARASGDSPQRQAIRARYESLCNPAPREKNFFETLFGGSSDQQQDQGVIAVPETEGDGKDAGNHSAHAGSQALCVRSCDGGFFPLNISARGAPDSELQDLCQALCPNTQVQLFTRNPNGDIDTAMGADGTAYRDLPNALKYTKTFDASCTCKPPNQSWVEALAHAEQVLDEMGGAKTGDTTVTEQQSRAMAQPQPAKPGKGGSPADAAAKPSAGAKASAGVKSPTEVTVIDSAGPDGAPRQVRVVGPTY